MMSPKIVELYAVLLILCTAVMFFGLFQMQSGLSAVMNHALVSPLQSILYGVQIAALCLVVTTFIIFVFFKKLYKSHSELKKKAGVKE
ncbi:MAG: hypothetical protein WC634_02805 [archaeon]